MQRPSKLNIRKRAAGHTPLHPSVSEEPRENAPALLPEDQQSRLAQALRNSYEAVYHILGSKRFSLLAEAYAAKHPSRDAELEPAGRHFESFLKKAPISRKFKFLPDLAHMEWQIVEAFSQPQGEPAGPHELARLKHMSTEKLRIAFQPSVSVFESRWPVFDIWQARKKPLKEISIHLKNRAQNVLVYRHAATVRVECIDERQYLFLDHLLKGLTLGKACEKLVSRYSKERIPLAEWFAHWASSGIFSGF